jgi:hypothetical protein
MPGYTATSNSQLKLAIGVQTLLTQSALDYRATETIQLTYTLNPNVFMSGTITAYSPTTGSMTVNITRIATGGLQLQPVWNTQQWGSTGEFTSWNLRLIGGVPVSTATVTPTIMVRNLGSNWDPQRGNGLADFLVDQYAVAQIIVQRLRLLRGEWFENTNLGLPLFQRILGVPNTSVAIALIYREQILAVPYVTEITSFQVTFAPTGRTFTFTASVETAFGPITVSKSN